MTAYFLAGGHLSKSRSTALLLLLGILLGFTESALAVSAGNASTPTSIFGGSEPEFESEPRGRGTIGIIKSCTATFIICIWTSMHADIPPLHASIWISVVYKAVWMLCAALIPEAIIMSAFWQWRQAKEIMTVWERKFGGDLNIAEARREISMLEGFFVVMGGFTIRELTDKEEGKDVYYSTTLTPYGFKQYVGQGRINPHVFERRHIDDKGKGNSVAKALACLQASSLIVECIARMVSKLPLTLLEIHIVIQVLCTIVTYYLWWHKPLDVREPILITILPEPEEQHQVPYEGLAATSGYPGSYRQPLLTTSSIAPFLSLDAAKEDLKRQKEQGHSWGDSEKENEEPLYVTRRGPPELLTTAYQASYDLVRYFISKRRRMMLFETFLTVPISFMHSLAWNSHFPTLFELWMWRACSIGMCVFPLSCSVMAYVGGYERLMVGMLFDMSLYDQGRLSHLWGFCVEMSQKTYKAATAQGKRRHIGMICGIIFSINCYSICVWYITIESYISIRSPAKGSFRTPAWSDYIPHL